MAPTLRARSPARCSKGAQEFSVRRCVEAYEGLYDALLSGRSPMVAAADAPSSA
jgi:hypothetical protein